MSSVSSVDLAESYEAGRAAVRAAVAGESDQMISLVRISSEPYEWTTGTVDLSGVANMERPLPDEYLSRETGELTPAFIEYVRPLIGDPLPPYTRLTPHYVVPT
jgi:6-phosphofructokinase 1